MSSFPDSVKSININLDKELLVSFDNESHVIEPNEYEEFIDWLSDKINEHKLESFDPTSVKITFNDDSFDSSVTVQFYKKNRLIFSKYSDDYDYVDILCKSLSNKSLPNNLPNNLPIIIIKDLAYRQLKDLSGYAFPKNVSIYLFYATLTTIPSEDYPNTFIITMDESMMPSTIKVYDSVATCTVTENINYITSNSGLKEALLQIKNKLSDDLQTTVSDLIENLDLYVSIENR
jgi:hypothetical protein